MTETAGLPSKGWRGRSSPLHPSDTKICSEVSACIRHTSCITLNYEIVFSGTPGVNLLDLLLASEAFPIPRTFRVQLCRFLRRNKPMRDRLGRSWRLSANKLPRIKILSAVECFQSLHHPNFECASNATLSL
ncbi:hypothetical protein TWF694_001570 [Orbilia ellipsospora]|uniref:Uncharacterized protein n=1 Tax=Orbilia ellipsospora TaxID=2528407 RepID=A0AAV9XSF8_9PEZI